MNRTSPLYRIFSPSNINNVRRAHSNIYTLPVDTLSRLGQFASEIGTRGHIEALVADRAINLRVDWDGSPSSMGHFEVLVGVSEWKACELIDPNDFGIDVISPSQPMDGETFLVRFRRGPMYAGYTFGVKAVPIAWTYELPAELEPSYVAERGKDYDYEAGMQPDLVPWTYSVPADGVHRLTLELSMGRDYEMWVRLQDPNDPNNWRVQDPIIRQPVPTVQCASRVPA